MWLTIHAMHNYVSNYRNIRRRKNIASKNLHLAILSASSILLRAVNDAHIIQIAFLLRRLMDPQLFWRIFLS